MKSGFLLLLFGVATRPLKLWTQFLSFSLFSSPPPLPVYGRCQRRLDGSLFPLPSILPPLPLTAAPAAASVAAAAAASPKGPTAPARPGQARPG